MGKSKNFYSNQKGFSSALVLSLFFLFLSIGIGLYFLYFKEKKESNESPKNKQTESPITLQAGVMTLPELKPVIEPKTSPTAQTQPQQQTQPQPKPQPKPQPTPDEFKQIVPKSNKILNKKILLVIYDPKVDGRNVTSRFSWGNPNSITDSIISFFNEVTGGRLRYSIAKRVNLETFPVKQDKFIYTAETYKKCIDSSNKSADCHAADTADYLEIINSTNACELANNGEIDELWIWGGPYFGFWESNVAGPKGFFVNSGPTVGSSCKKMLPIMGYNYERGLNEAVHNFGHRAESVMKYVYGSWEPEPTHSWNKFSLLDKDKKDLAGCGNFQFAANSVRDYEYTSSKTVKSNCHEYFNFPDIKGVYKDINCKDWGCTEIGYYKYWWKNFPQNEGKSVDGFTQKEIFNNWLLYVFDFAWID